MTHLLQDIATCEHICIPSTINILPIAHKRQTPKPQSTPYDLPPKPRTLTAILDATLETEASDRQNDKMMTDDLENRQNLRQETLEHGRRRNLTF